MRACCSCLLRRATSRFLPALSPKGKQAAREVLDSSNLGQEMTPKRPLENLTGSISRAERSRSTKRVRKSLAAVAIVPVADADSLADDLGAGDEEATSCT